MSKKWILTAAVTDPITREPQSKALVHNQADLDRRLDEAKTAGVKTSVREVK